jgi:hypothetical protein
MCAVWKKYLRAMGVEEIDVYALRHAFEHGGMNNA